MSDLQTTLSPKMLKKLKKKIVYTPNILIAFIIIALSFSIWGAFFVPIAYFVYGKLQALTPIRVTIISSGLLILSLCLFCILRIMKLYGCSKIVNYSCWKVPLEDVEFIWETEENDLSIKQYVRYVGVFSIDNHKVKIEDYDIKYGEIGDMYYVVILHQNNGNAMYCLKESD